jgi:hypothetical protein
MSSLRHRRDPVPPGPWVYVPIDDWSAVNTGDRQGLPAGHSTLGEEPIQVEARTLVRAR